MDYLYSVVRSLREVTNRRSRKVNSYDPPRVSRPTKKHAVSESAQKSAVNIDSGAPGVVTRRARQQAPGKSRIMSPMLHAAAHLKFAPKTRSKLKSKKQCQQKTHVTKHKPTTNKRVSTKTAKLTTTRQQQQKKKKKKKKHQRQQTHSGSSSSCGKKGNAAPAALSLIHI